MIVALSALWMRDAKYQRQLETLKIPEGKLTGL